MIGGKQHASAALSKISTCHCAWGTPRTHAYIQPHYCHCPWGSGRWGGGEGGYRLRFLSKLFCCRGVRTATDPNARQGLLSLTAANSIGGILLGFPPLPRESSNLTVIRCRTVFVQQSFQLRLGLLCLLLVPVLVGRRGGRQRGVCVGCRRILLKDMRVVAFVFCFVQILRLCRSCGLAVVSIFV